MRRVILRLRPVRASSTQGEHLARLPRDLLYDENPTVRPVRVGRPRGAYRRGGSVYVDVTPVRPGRRTRVCASGRAGHDGLWRLTLI